MKNFVKLTKNEMKLVLGGLADTIIGEEGGSCSVNHTCSSNTSISCTGEPGTCTVNSTEHWVSCDGAKTYCN